MGDRREALEAYEHVPSTLQRAPESLMSQAQLLLETGQADRARRLLQTAAQSATGETASEAAYELGRLAHDRGEHATALEWFTKAVTAAPDSRSGRLALLGTGDSLAALNRKQEALAAYTKLVDSAPLRPSPAHAGEREMAGEAAYRSGKLLHAAGRHSEAVYKFIISAAFFTTGSPGYGRALVGAVQCFVATGDRPAAEAYYEQLQATGAKDTLLGEARRALDTAAVESALPRDAR
jgi:tetratricopeptide (TPR) repeat protein